MSLSSTSMKRIPFIYLLLIAVQSIGQTPLNQPPAWSKSAIWYQVFVERFYNGDKKNDPILNSITVPGQMEPPADWKITPWTQDWFGQQDWERKLNKPFNETIQFRRYGGDLQGLLLKLDYLQQLGINALFLNPINDAPSLHKYDARSYHHVDVHFGPDPVGDQQIIAAENPADPSTWQWTSADQLFLKLVKECHRRGIRIIMDYSWNHTGILFWAMKDIRARQNQSAYRDWYDIEQFDDPATPANEFRYHGWLGNNTLPEIKKTDITTPRVVGHPYEGNISEAAKRHQFAVARRWLAPEGNRNNGIDGFRLDVADQIGMGFWRDFRREVRAVNPDAYLIGEIWWEAWPDKLMDPAPYLQGDIFDAVMFYQAYRPARYFFARTQDMYTAERLRDSLTSVWSRIPPGFLAAQMNVSSSHDAPRLLSDFYNPHKYKYRATPNDNPAYKTGKPGAEAYRNLRLYLIHLFTSPGAPQIWNGEEMGMWGGDDPHCRKPLMWPEYRFQPETRNNYQPGLKVYDAVAFNPSQFNWYKKLISLRKKHPVFAEGNHAIVFAEGNKLITRRWNNQENVYICFNRDAKSGVFRLPAGQYSDLLTGRKLNVSNSFRLPAWTGMVLKKLPE